MASYFSTLGDEDHLVYHDASTFWTPRKNKPSGMDEYFDYDTDYAGYPKRKVATTPRRMSSFSCTSDPELRDDLLDCTMGDFHKLS